VTFHTEVEKKWKADGYSCDLWVDPPGQAWENFVHNSDEMVHLLEGNLKLEILGKEKILNPGEEAFIPAGARHSVWNIGTSEAKWLYGYRSLT
jgi:quercetin dioxygenase-like cupin family protein